MRLDEAKKLERMNNYEAVHFLIERNEDTHDILEHLSENCDTGDSRVVMGRLQGYLTLLEAETELLRKLITGRNLEKAAEEKRIMD